MDCQEPDCDSRAAVELHIPWGDNRALCPSHARPVAREDGVVASPLEGAEDDWPGTAIEP